MCDCKHRVTGTAGQQSPHGGRGESSIFDWASEFAGYITEAAEHLRQTAMQEAEQYSEAVGEEDPGMPVGAEQLRLLFRARAMSLASALLALLAIELALKAYQIQERGQHETGHDLQKLFDSLNEETRTRLKNLGPEVNEALGKHRQGFVSLRYLFEELGNARSVAIPRPDDPLHAAATKILEALKEELDVPATRVRAGGG